MIAADFVNWSKTARVDARIAAASALARDVVGDQPASDRHATEAALTMLLDDPSPRVRAAMAESLSTSSRAPMHIVVHLAADQPEVAGPLLVRSPLLTDADLVDLVAGAGVLAQRFVAMRACLSNVVCAALAEIGDVDSCREMLGNPGADIAALSFRRMVERFGADPAMRQCLMATPRLPADCRRQVLVELGAALRRSPLVLASMGAARAERVTRDACLKASLAMVDNLPGHDHAALIEHLRLSGDLTCGFVLRCVAHGKIEFFGRILSSLTGQSLERVRALLVGGRPVALRALMEKAGLSGMTHEPVLRALGIWRDVANAQRIASVQEVSLAMMEAVDAALRREPADRDLASLSTLLKGIHVEALREAARDHAKDLVAA